MSGRPSRRDLLVEAALQQFAERGYEATSVADIAGAAEMTKAAFSYHFPAKDDLLQSLVDPFLSDLDEVTAGLTGTPDWPADVESLLGRYLTVLLDHVDIVLWIDSDKAVLRHPLLGKRLRANNQAMRRAITGGSKSRAALLAASATLGTLWRPLRNLPEVDATRYVSGIIATAMAAAAHARGLG